MMPVLPGAQQRLLPDASSSVASYRGGIAENTQGAAGELTQQLGGEIVQMADKRRNQLDELRVIEASTDLRKRELALTFDEKEGYQSIKGGDVIKRPVVQDYAAKYKTEVDRVSAQLSPKQREMFAGHATASSMNFQANVMRHAMAETEKYGGEVYKADLQSRYDTAGMSYKNDMLTKSQLEGIDKATFHRMDSQGIDGPVREEFVKAARGGLHATVIDKAIAAGDTEFANEYFYGNKEKGIPAAKEDMTGDQRNTTERQLKPATDFALGKGIATEAFQRELKDPQFNAAQYIVDKAGSNPQAAAAAHSVYVQFVQERDTARLAQRGTFFKTFYENPNRANMNTITNTKEFRLMDDMSQSVVLHTMSQAVQSAEDRVVSLQDRAENKIYRDENREYTRQMHEEAAARRAEQALSDSLPAVTLTNELIRSPNLAHMKPEEIYGKASEIGIDNVKLVLKAQAQVNKTLNSFQVDRDILKESKLQSVLKDKAKSAAIDGMADIEAQRFIQQNGREPTKIEQVEILRKVTSESVSKTSTLGPFSWTSEKKLYEMPPEQRNFYIGIQSAAEKAGRPALSDEQLTAAWELSQKAQKNPPSKAAAPAAALSDSTFRAAQAARQKANQESLAATNKKTEDLKAQLAIEEAKLAEMDANISKKIGGIKSKPVGTTESRAMDAEVAAMPQRKREEATVSSYPGIKDQVDVTDLGKAEDELTKKAVEVTKTPVESILKSPQERSIIEKTLKSTKIPRNFSQPVEGRVTPFKPATQGAGAITIEAAAGAAVKAAADGVVKFVGNMRRYGEVVIVEHGGKYMTVYGHNRAVDRKVGDTVRQGDQIGSAEGGPTLFEVRRFGERIDPMKWLKKAGR